MGQYRAAAVVLIGLLTLTLAGGARCCWGEDDPEREEALRTAASSGDTEAVAFCQRWRPVSPVYAVRPGGRGDLSLAEGEESNDHVAWCHLRDGTYVPSPILYGDYLYTNSNNGRIGCYDSRTGERQYRDRICPVRTSFSASPVAGDGKLYLTSETDGVYVVKAGPTLEVLATNRVGETVMATPAISAGVIYLRTLQHLIAIGDSDPETVAEEAGAPAL